MAAVSCSPDVKNLGKLPTGASVGFAADSAGKWGLEISGDGQAAMGCRTPVKVEYLAPDSSVVRMEVGYDAVHKSNGKAVAVATLPLGEASLEVCDEWCLQDTVLVVSRTAAVSGTVEGAGFGTAVGLEIKSGWEETSFFAPGLLYGDPTYDGPNSPGGTRFAEAGFYTIREDFLPAPLYGALLPDGTSVTMLDMEPDGATTLEETKTGLSDDVRISDVFAFGAFGSKRDGDAVEMDFWMPGSACSLPWERPLTGVGAPQSRIRRSSRYNPVSDGFVQRCKIGFRIAEDDTFPQLTKNAYRWAWNVLKPKVNHHDIDLVRRSLADLLSSQVYTIGGRTGLPFIVYTESGEVWKDNRDPNFFWRATMGFVGKNVEAADELLREGDRDTTERGRKMRRQGLDIIATFIREVPMKNPTCTGFNLKTGAPSMTNPPVWFVREATDDMRMLMEAYEREKAAGIEHPEWIAWCKDFADWLLPYQREDGHFPRSFMLGTSEIEEESGTTSYNVVPLFLQLGRNLGDDRYEQSALRAAEYVWESFGKRGVFVGGAIDNPNVTDKEAGLLSLEAFLALYEETGEGKWLERARVAADFAESWTYIWNVPMPVDAAADELMWKRDVPTVGVQGITAQVAGHVDQFLDMSVPAYVRLAKYTGDSHYYDFARLLLHNCKGMVALPGRMHGMCAPGFQTENWRMGAAWEGRGFGTPQKWMPWVATNHLYGMNALEAYDPEAFRDLAGTD